MLVTYLEERSKSNRMQNYLVLLVRIMKNVIAILED